MTSAIQTFFLFFNWPAFLVGFGAVFLLGALWYQKFFLGKPWARLWNLSEDQLSKTPVLGFVFALLTALVMAGGASGFLALFELTSVSYSFDDMNGLSSAAAFTLLPLGTKLLVLGLVAGAVGVFFVLALGMLYLFARKSFLLVLIDGGYLVAALVTLVLINSFIPMQVLKTSLLKP